MDDEKIIELFWDRSEDAIKETENKYGRYLKSIAMSILSDEESSQECLNDTLLSTWNAIPPARPQMLQTFLGKIMRNAAINRWHRENTEKRGKGRIPEVLEELKDLSDGGADTEKILDTMVFSEVFRAFLAEQKQVDRIVFMKRYWHFMSTREIAKDMRLSESNVRVILHRCRNSLRERLKKEGFEI